MRAVTYNRVGSADDVLTISEVPTPSPGDGEVRVRIVCSGVNPSDVKTRGGTRSPTLPFPMIIPHSDGAGIIDCVGNGVPESRLGERVWVWNACWGRPFGTAAEYCTLPAAQAVRLPEPVDFAAGACLGIPALTAYHAVCVDGGVQERSVLVAGGAGAVGNYAIQFARIKGAARILTSVSGPEKARLAHLAGAHDIVNYRTEDLVSRVAELTTEAGVERILEVDLAANLTTDLQLIRPEGRLIVYGSSAMETPVPFVPSILKNVRYTYFIVYHLTTGDRVRAIADLTGMLERGELMHNIARRVPLERAAEAHVLVEQGSVAGNVVIDVSDSD